MNKVTNVVTVDGVTYLDGRDAIVGFLQKLHAGLRTLADNGFKRVRIKVRLEGLS